MSPTRIIRPERYRDNDSQSHSPNVCRLRVIMVSTVLAAVLGLADANAQSEDPFRRFLNAAEQFMARSKALGRTDAFNIRVAFRRAISREETGISYRWNNVHTDHYGEIVLVDFTKPLARCVNYIHSYNAGNASTGVERGRVCKDNLGAWNDINIPAVFEAATNNTSQPVRSSDRKNQSPYVGADGIVPVSRDVQKVQQQLQELNYDPGPMDGRLGPKTRLAIEQFQRDRGLTMTGDLSADLIAALNNGQTKDIDATVTKSDEGHSSTVDVASLESTRSSGGAPVIVESLEVVPVESAASPSSSFSSGVTPTSGSSVIGIEGKASPGTTETVGDHGIERQPAVVSSPAVSSSKWGTLQIFGIPWMYLVAGLIGFGVLILSLSRLILPPKREGNSPPTTPDSVITTNPTANDPTRTAQSPQPLMQTVVDDAADSILQSITEFDDIIRETELVLVQPQIDRNSRTEILRAVETARSMMAQTLEEAPVTGHDRERTGKTIEKATKLITEVLENNPVEVTELPGQLQAGSRRS